MYRKILILALFVAVCVVPGKAWADDPSQALPPVIPIHRPPADESSCTLVPPARLSSVEKALGADVRIVGSSYSSEGWSTSPRYSTTLPGCGQNNDTGSVVVVAAFPVDFVGTLLVGVRSDNIMVFYADQKLRQATGKSTADIIDGMFMSVEMSYRN